jgi:3-methyladenine DNA glycosylase/8-oxoguanine DNA glycosylase
MEIERISDNWRPYRTWATLLLRTFLEDQTHEIAGQPAAPATKSLGSGG